MSWSYDPTIPTPTDQVRFVIGDTDTTDQQLANEEILFVLADNNTVVNRTALACCEALQAKYARMVDTKVDNLQESASQRLEQYSKLVIQLRAKLSRGGIRPLMGGQSISGKRSNRDNTDLVQPAFTVGQFSERGVSPNATLDDNPNNE